MHDSIDYAAPVREENPWRTVTRWLIVINVAVFVIDMLLVMTHHGRIQVRHDGQPLIQTAPNGQPFVVADPPLESLGYFSVDLAIIGKQVWRFITYQFCHAGIEHIALNMIGLFMVGPLVEWRMGRWRFLGFYLTCGIAGPVAHLLLAKLHFLQLDIYTPLVGASASIYGVLVAAARMAPDEIVMLAFPPIDMKLKNFVLIMIGLSLVAVTWQWQNAGGHAAHLGGAVVGWFLSRRFARSREKAL